MVEIDPSLANSAAAMRLIHILQAIGFENRSFSKLHHLRAKNRYETIGNFSSYCRTPREFRKGGENHRVVARLNYVLAVYICRPDSRPCEQLSTIYGQDSWDPARFFDAAAEEAYQWLPPAGVSD